MEFFIWFEPIAVALQVAAICVLVCVVIAAIPAFVFSFDSEEEEREKAKKAFKIIIFVALIAGAVAILFAPLADFQDLYNDSLEYQQKAAEAAKRLPAEQ